MKVSWGQRAKLGAKWAGLSMLLFGGPLLLCGLAWFPGNFFWMDGGWQALAWMLPLASISGGILAAVAAKSDKKHLALDLTVIGAGQAALTAVLVFALWQESPAALVLEGKVFHSIPQKTLGNSLSFGKAFAKESGVPLYEVRLPADPKGRLAEAARARQEATPFFAMPHLWEPVDWSGEELRVATISDPAQVKAKEGAAVAKDWLEKNKAGQRLVLVSLRFGNGIMSLSDNSRKTAGEGLAPANIGLPEVYMMER